MIIARLYDFEVSGYIDRMKSFETKPVVIETKRVSAAILNDIGNPVHIKLLSLGVDEKDIQDGKYTKYLYFMVLQTLLDSGEYSLK